MDKLIETSLLEIVDLGVASIETKGPPGFSPEGIGQQEGGFIAQD
jgi:hypothetical protein